MDQITVTEDGDLIEPDLHDARMERIDFLGNRVLLHFKTPAGMRVVLSLDDVKHMTSIGLAESNVILDIAVQNGDLVDLKTLTKLLPGTSNAQVNYRRTIIEKLIENELMLVHVSPSYGGEIIVLSKSVSQMKQSGAEHD